MSTTHRAPRHRASSRHAVASQPPATRLLAAVIGCLALALGSLLAMTAPSAAAESHVVLKLRTIADTYVTSHAPGLNLGRSTQLQASDETGHRKLALLKFHLPAVDGATVDSARLVLTRTHHHLGATVAVDVVHGRSWHERHVTRRSFPAVGAPLDVVKTRATDGSVSFDVTSAVRNARCVSLALSSPSRHQFAAFRSREWGGIGVPTLVVDYVRPVSPGHSTSSAPAGTPTSTGAVPSETSAPVSASSTVASSSSHPVTSVPASATSTAPATSSGAPSTTSVAPSTTSRAPSTPPSSATSTPVPTTTPPQPSCVSNRIGIPASGAYVGAAVGGTQSVPTLESTVGRLAIHRTYYDASQVDWAITTVKADLAAGRLPWISFKMPYSWADMAAGRGDAWATDLANRLAAVGGPVWLAFHHEPEGDGVLSDWTAMQRHLAPIIHSHAPNVAYTVIFTAWDVLYGPSEYSLDKLWPGDQYVDVLGMDFYNKYGTSLGNTMTDSAKYFAAISSFAQAHHVHWALGETAYTAAAQSADPTWLTTEYHNLLRYGGSALTYFDSSRNSIADWTLSDSGRMSAYRTVLDQTQRLC